MSPERAADTEWFAVRCLFSLPDPLGEGTLYEERITLWNAASIDVAIAEAEAEAAEYAGREGASYVELAQAYAMYDEPGHGAEVFSLMRASQLARNAYLDRFFDTGAEREGKSGDESKPA